MVRSPAFARIRSEVIAVLRAIPRGQITTFGQVAAFLDVMPRHVAFLVATLDDWERAGLPWHRAVSTDGRLRRVRRDPEGTSQAELLRAEGVPLAAPDQVDMKAARLFVPTTSNTGVTPTPHPRRLAP